MNKRISKKLYKRAYLKKYKNVSNENILKSISNQIKYISRNTTYDFTCDTLPKSYTVIDIIVDTNATE